ncbi:MAG: hypothetical protein PF436_03605 [Prolixibacteraceae bacterium]|jgi:hypothetical protein|nr:hypothetical protein [Prolixibacteraceae bacterium]
MKNFVLISISLFLVFSGFAQEKYSSAFIDYLVSKGSYHEALFLIDKEIQSSKSSYIDSLNYYKGWAHYSLKELDYSSESLLKVSLSSEFYHKSQFFAAYNQTYLGDYKRAKSVFHQIETNKTSLMALKNFELSGVHFLEGDFDGAKHYLYRTDTTVAVLNTQLSNMKMIIAEIENHKAKKPWVAGLMSAVVPGSGKFYAGKKGEGIAAFLGSVSFGLIAWENYRKLGVKHPKTIIFGSIFAATYVSNIYGSVVSVRIYETEYNNALHNQILFQLHIPLRNYFD